MSQRYKLKVARRRAAAAKAAADVAKAAAAAQARRIRIARMAVIRLRDLNVDWAAFAKGLTDSVRGEARRGALRPFVLSPSIIPFPSRNASPEIVA